jgi:hypothetical protein
MTKSSGNSSAPNPKEIPPVPKELLRTSPDVSLLESVIEIEDDSVDKL